MLTIAVERLKVITETSTQGRLPQNAYFAAVRYAVATGPAALPTPGRWRPNFPPETFQRKLFVNLRRAPSTARRGGRALPPFALCSSGV